MHYSEAESRLKVLHKTIESRVAAIVATHPDWPCRKGCAHCCRHLAAIPQLSPAERVLLRRGLARLPIPIRREIGVRSRQTLPARPITCPYLDPVTDACLVYEYRPIACRAYGFYVERDKGLYCGVIQARVEAGDFDDVVWGNAQSIEA